MRRIAFLLILLPVVGGCAAHTEPQWGFAPPPDLPDVADRAPPKSNLKPPLDFRAWRKAQWEQSIGIGYDWEGSPDVEGRLRFASSIH